MGPKVTINSATLMNKGLEIIEAHHLFSLKSEEIDVLVHPQSVVHGLVEFRDGSVVAQLGSPDMRIPIAHCLAWPRADRRAGGAARSRRATGTHLRHRTWTVSRAGGLRGGRWKRAGLRPRCSMRRMRSL